MIHEFAHLTKFEPALEHVSVD